MWEKQVTDAYAAQNWAGVVDIMEAALQAASAMDTPWMRLKLLHSHVRLGDADAIGRQFEIVRRKHPDSSILLLARAEYAMVQGDYRTALDYWDLGVVAAEKAQGSQEPVSALPPRGSVFDWYEAAWIRCVQQWDQVWNEIQRKPSSVLYRRLIQTLTSLNEHQWAEWLGRRAYADYPHDEQLGLQVCETLARCYPDVGSHRLQELLLSLGDNPLAISLANEVREAELMLKELEELGPPKEDQIRILTVYRHSGADLLARVSNYWNERRLHTEAIRLAKRDGWPEQTAEIDLVSARAWEAARNFGKASSKEVGISAPDLARAAFHFFKQEVTQKVPVDRIADEIARTRKNEPLFLDLVSTKIPYMVSYPTSRMQWMYFYDALRKRGCNVQFVRFPRRQAPKSEAPEDLPAMIKMPTLTLSPQPAQLRPPARTIIKPSEDLHSIVVPAGIRSVRRLLDRIPEAIVVNSGSAVKGFAYDRSVSQEWDYDVNLSLHSDAKDLLPTFRIPTESVRAWRRGTAGFFGSIAAPSTAEEIQAFLSSGTWVVDDWSDWIRSAIVPYFKDFVHRGRATLEARGITDVHVCDYLYAEPVLVASMVKERGGRVHVWPHSTNPVHIQFQDHGAIEKVHAVTRGGAALWRRALPHTHVQHDSSLMLDLPEPNVTFQSGVPLSVVVIGGRPIMRNLPILDIAAHEGLYKRFFESLEPLVNSGMVRVYFKPRGLTGEHESWLEKLVGRAANWQRVLEHPLRMQLPNPLFVSLSVGSSALLEGGTRGIPAMIVREAFARDYLATEDDLFEALDVESAVARVSALASEPAWTEARDRLMEGLVRELTTEPNAFPCDWISTPAQGGFAASAGRNRPDSGMGR